MTRSSSAGSIRWLTLATLFGLLIVGWWPFSFRPTNGVVWLTESNGLGFEPPGIAWDPQPLQAIPQNQSNGIAQFTVELWVCAGSVSTNDVHHLLTIHDGRLRSNFVLCQWKSELLLRVPAPNSRGFREIGLSDALEIQKPRMITVVGDTLGTSFYLDGELAQRFPGFVVQRDRLNGRLILGDAATGKHAWTGQIFGLALLDRAIDQTEAALRNAAWHGHLWGQLAVPGLRALYPFNEGIGEWAHDISSHRHQLSIPKRYRVPQKTVLALPGKELRHDSSDRKDILVNVAGFIPIGCLMLLCQRLSAPKSWFSNLLLTILVAITVSLLIELVQVWLPSRVSSATDVLCNAAGAAIGATLAMWLNPSVNRNKERR